MTTIHGHLDIKDLEGTILDGLTIPWFQFRNISASHYRTPGRIDTVYHGLPQSSLTFHSRPGDYLAFLGRISPEKRPDRAISIARAAGWPLKIAAKVDPADREYFKRQIRLLHGTDQASSSSARLAMTTNQRSGQRPGAASSH